MGCYRPGDREIREDDTSRGWQRQVRPSLLLDSALDSNPTERAVPVGGLQQRSVFSSSEKLEASDLQELL